MSKFIRFIAAVALLLLPLLSVSIASAATVTWDGGGGDNNWTTAANWAGDVAPSPGDSLIFSGGTRLSPVNDFAAGTVFADITFDSPNFTLTGNAIELTPSGSQAIAFNELSTTYAINTTITAASAKTIYSSHSANNITADITLNLTGGGDISFETDNDTTLTVSGVIDGSTDSFVIAPSSFVNFTNSNTFASTNIYIDSGSLVTCAATNCFGASTGDVDMNGGRLDITVAMTIPNDIRSINGGGLANVNLYADTTLSGAIQAIENLAISVDNGVDGTLSGNISVDDGRQLNLAGLSINDHIYQNGGTISGAGVVYVVQVHAVLHGNNSYGGETLVDDGVLDIRHANALGSTAGYTSVHDGATLLIPTAMTLAEDIRIGSTGATGFSGAIEMTAGSDIEISGDITVLSDATIANTSSGSELMMSGAIDGTGNLTFESDTNSSHFRFSGASANTYIGTTTVNGSILYLDKNNVVTAIPGDLVVNAGAGDDALVWTLAEQQVADNAIVTLNDNGSYRAIFRVDTVHTESIGGLSGDGHLQIDGLRTVIENNTDLTFTGTVYGPGILSKQGIGTLSLNGDFADSGSGFPTGVEIHEGRLHANSINTSFEFATWTVTGGTLSGSESIGATSVDGGTFAPGNSPGCLNIAGDLTFSINTTFSVEIGGTAQCSDYDHSAVSGTATLSGADLDVSQYGGFEPADGDTFQIISAASVLGTFNNTPDSTIITNGSGQRFRVNYTTTNVTLTYVVDSAVAPAIPPAPPKTGLEQHNSYAIPGLFSTGLILLYAARRYGKTTA